MLNRPIILHMALRRLFVVRERPMDCIFMPMLRLAYQVRTTIDVNRASLLIHFFVCVCVWLRIPVSLVSVSTEHVPIDSTAPGTAPSRAGLGTAGTVAEVSSKRYVKATEAIPEEFQVCGLCVVLCAVLRAE